MKRQDVSMLLLCIVAAVGLSSCASILTKSHQDVTFKGLPGTAVIDQKKNQTITEVGSNGFSTVSLKKQLSGKDLLIVKDGYEQESRKLGTKIQGPFWANILVGGLPGVAIDAATGKMMKYNTDLIDVTLSRKSDPQAKVSRLPIMQEESEEIVGVAEAGTTEMEKIILRWFVDSDPRGSRIFYRVISSIPDKVSNTNETYLTTTPLEETRSFNIPGLTYDNSQDVTLEIKVTKRGYEDQVKRYNVRQALDQQEISGFFELVPIVVKNTSKLSTKTSKNSSETQIETQTN